MTKELLSAEQLDLVVGGTQAETELDRAFFQGVFGYDMSRMNIGAAFAKHGVNCCYQVSWAGAMATALK